jgi:hypothetical protein
MQQYNEIVFFFLIVVKRNEIKPLFFLVKIEESRCNTLMGNGGDTLYDLWKPNGDFFASAIKIVSMNMLIKCLAKPGLS